MSWVCNVCGFENDDDATTCVCGNQPDEFEVTDSEDSSSDIFKQIEEKAEESAITSDSTSVAKADAKKIKVKVPEKPEKKAKKPSGKPVEAGDEVLIKEVEGWRFTYSKSEDCMYLGTPALQSFRLKLTLQDLQELLDSLHEITGVEKPRETVELQKSEVLEFISVIDDMIEEKRSDVKIKFSDEEIKSLSELIIEKLNR
jgi:hypothetical protein